MASTTPARALRRKPFLNLSLGSQLGDFSLDDLRRLGLPVDPKAAKELKTYPKLAAVRYIRAGGLTPRPIKAPTPKGIVVPSPLPFRRPASAPAMVSQPAIGLWSDHNVVASSRRQQQPQLSATAASLAAVTAMMRQPMRGSPLPDVKEEEEGGTALEAGGDVEMDCGGDRSIAMMIDSHC